MESKSVGYNLEENENEKFQYEESEQEEIEYEEFEDTKSEDEGNLKQGNESENKNRIEENYYPKNISGKGNNYYFVNLNINNMNKGNESTKEIIDDNYSLIPKKQSNNNFLGKIGEAILDQKYTNRNFIAKIQNEKIDYPRQDIVGKEERNDGKENSDEVKINKSQNKNRINEVYVYPSEIISIASIIHYAPILKVAKSICRITIPFTATKNKMGSGFLINLSSKENPFYCLMTNEHVIKKKLIEKRITITFSYDIGRESRKIKLEKRIIKEFKNRELDESYEFDVTVIQIKPEDKIDKEYFLLPNYDFMSDFGGLKSKEITIVQYPKTSLCFSNGEIKDINNYELVHSASTDLGSSGSPIFLKDTEKVIGIHKNGDSDKNHPKNYGDFIGPIYHYFKNRYKLNKSKLNIFNKGPAPGYDDKYMHTFYGGKSNNKKVKKRKKNMNHANRIHEIFTIDNNEEGNGELVAKNGDNSNGITQKELFNGTQKIKNYYDLDTLEKGIDYEKLILRILKNTFK